MAFGSTVTVETPSPDRRSAGTDPSCGGNVFAHISVRAAARAEESRSSATRSRVSRSSRCRTTSRCIPRPSAATGCARACTCMAIASGSTAKARTRCAIRPRPGNCSTRRSKSCGRSPTRSEPAAWHTPRSLDISENIEATRARDCARALARAARTRGIGTAVLTTPGVTGASGHAPGAGAGQPRRAVGPRRAPGRGAGRRGHGAHSPGRWGRSFKGIAICCRSWSTRVHATSARWAPCSISTPGRASSGWRMRGGPRRGDARRKRSPGPGGSCAPTRGRIAGDASRWSARQWSSSSGPDRPSRRPAVLVDPPRTGLSRGVAAALTASPVAGSSMSPAMSRRLARDARALADGGFRLRQMELFDLFPNTAHVETVSLLDRD